jgi:predicted dienelactone hydrolase
MFRRTRAFLMLIALSAAAHAAPAAATATVGFETATISPGPGPAIDIAIWYPSRSPASDRKLGGWIQHVASDGAVAGRRHPLIVISHGGGGWYGGHYDTALALARAGFIVAALTQPGDNFHDQSGAADMAARPRDLRRLVDYMIGDWREKVHVEPDNVGVFGFSNGGFTALVAIGGVPDFSRFPDHCRRHGGFDDCQILMRSGISLAGLADHFPQSVWVHDQRIKAAVIAAPALGFLFTRDGLSRVKVPVQLWRAGNDHVLPNPEYAEAVRRALPRAPQYHVIPNAGHFDFLAPCDPGLAGEMPAICRSSPGFSRAAFHQRFNAAVVAFFHQKLAGRD